MNELLTSRFVRDTSRAWYERLTHAGVPVAEIRDFAAVVADPQFVARNAFVEFESPTSPGTRMRVVGAGYVAATDGPLVSRPPPLLGEHTDELLTEIGYAPAAIADLRQRGIV